MTSLDDVCIEVEDEADVASILGVIFMSTMFVGVICFQTVIPAGSKERIVFYREQASCTHTHPYTRARPCLMISLGILDLRESVTATGNQQVPIAFR